MIFHNMDVTDEEDNCTGIGNGWIYSQIWIKKLDGDKCTHVGKKRFYITTSEKMNQRWKAHFERRNI